MTIEPQCLPGLHALREARTWRRRPTSSCPTSCAEDLSLFTLVDSDFAMLNQNLAEFYGIDGRAGRGPVSTRARHPAMERGGLLSHGAFLAGHSDGNEPHPIKRAVWVKEKILGSRRCRRRRTFPTSIPIAPESAS